MEDKVSAAKVLLVEDEGFMRRLMAEALKDEGFEVVEATNGGEAVLLLNALASFDILFTNINLSSEIDGIDVALFSRKTHPAIHVVLASAYVGTSLDRLGCMHPAAVFLPKPYDVDDVVLMLRSMSTMP